MAKKENNKRNHSSREAWLQQKRANRPKQVWAEGSNDNSVPIHVRPDRTSY